MVELDGKVAVQHYTSNGHSLQVGEHTYTWIPKHNVSLCWIEKEDLPFVLNIKAKICCGKMKQRFFLASQTNVNIWNTGDR